MKNGPYTLCIAPDNYPGKKYRGRYVYEHHLKWWVKTQRLIPKGFVIHHKNGDHRDNRIKNLQLMSEKDHRKIHSELKRKFALTKTKCTMCRKLFEILKGRLKVRLRVNKRGIFCTKICADNYERIVGKCRNRSRTGLLIRRIERCL